MPKAKWGAGDKALTAGDIDGAERQESRPRYSGPMLIPSGTYRWTIQYIKQAESAKGNPMAEVMLTLDGAWRKNHAEYDGFPLWDRIPIMTSTVGRVANFMDAIGGTGRDLIDGSIMDENKRITKLGSVGDPKGLMVYCTIQRNKPTKEYPDPKMEPGFDPYIIVEGDVDEVADGADAGDAPF